MDTLYKIIGILCVVSYITGILFNISHSAYTEKALKLTLAIYVISAITVPVKKLEIYSYINNNEELSYSQQAADYIKNRAQKIIEDNISAKLNEKRIAYNYVDVHINEESEIFQIDNICIYGVSMDQQMLAENVLQLDEKIVFGD
ncbi:MAG: hypothetical protein IKJ05_07110 [Oscillospiraceae bacterium]|nr:hypothetical protein [Oscillospiraceae bacterium]